jgi:hypothetical protein
MFTVSGKRPHRHAGLAAAGAKLEAQGMFLEELFGHDKKETAYEVVSQRDLERIEPVVSSVQRVYPLTAVTAQYEMFPITSRVAVGLPNTGKYDEDERTVGDCRG